MKIHALAILLLSIVATTAVACGTDSSGAASESRENDAARITATQAKEMVDAGRAVMVDTRSIEHFMQVHATGAVSAPIEEIKVDPSVASIKGIPADQELILYCT